MILLTLAASVVLAAAPRAGVLVMAHGGDEAWNQAVHETVAPLEKKVPVELAFGMADADTLQEAVAKLEKKGVRRISVVRLFVSGDSFLVRTRKILGLDPGAPPRPKDAPKPPSGHGHHHGAHGGMPMFHDPDTMPLWRVKSKSQIVVDSHGLQDGDESAKILAERAAALSKDPAKESVLVLAHGAGDESENARVHELMENVAQAIKAAKPFRDVRVETLREDWPDKRKAAEARIRDYITAA
ncbi:MAG: hypothetical protein HY925_15525, partial [Elusimicrobia bacterium]|nr:hypothetical protein [Elusimicrobiota bacterium]